MASKHPVSEDTSGFQALEVIRRVANSSEPVFGPAFRISDQQWGLHLASKIRGRDGRPLATVLAVLDFSRTIDPFMVERIGLGETGETYLVNGDGEIITESLFENGSGQDQPPETGGTHTTLNREGGTAIYRNHLGQEVLGSYLWLPRYEWAILAEIQTDEILRPLSWIKSMGILTAFVGDGYLSRHGLRRQQACFEAHHPYRQCRAGDGSGAARAGNSLFQQG